MKGRSFGQVSYVYSTWDGDIHAVARRFRVGLENICNASRRINMAEWKDIHPEVWATLLEPNQRVNVPLPTGELMWDWFPYRPRRAESLKDLCAVRNADKARTGMPALTPQFLWLHVVNWQFRDSYLNRRRPEAANLDKDPSAVTVPDKDIIWIPYPDLTDGGKVDVGTYGAKQSAPAAKNMVVTKPDWITDLVYYLGAIDDAEALSRANSDCDSLRQKGAVQMARFAALRTLVETMKTRAGGCNVDNLLDKMNAFEKIAGEQMAINPASYIELQADKDRQTLSMSIRDFMRLDVFKKLVDRAFANPKVDVNGTPLINKTCDTLRRAYQAWENGYYEKDCEDDLLAALKVAGKAQSGAPPAEAKIALASALSFLTDPDDLKLKAAGTAAALAGPIVGNLPGPSSLAVAIAKAVSERLVRRKLAGELDVGVTRDVVYKYMQMALRLSAEEKTLLDTILHEVDSATHLVGEDSALGSMLKFRAQEAMEANRKKFLESIADRTQKSIGWHGGVCLVNAFAVYYTLISPDEYSLRKVLNVIASGGTGAVAAAKAAESALILMKACSRPWQEKFLQFTKVLDSRAATGVMGSLGAVVAVVAGSITVYDGYRKSKPDLAVAGIAQILGGASLGLATYFIVIGTAPYTAPVLIPEIAASIFLLISTVSSNWDTLKDLLVPGTKKVLSYHLNDFESSGAFKTVSAKAPSLKSSFDEVRAAMNSAVFKDFVEYYAWDVRDSLSALFGAPDIKEMFVAGRPGTLPALPGWKPPAEA
jgi:hypothetical protein